MNITQIRKKAEKPRLFQKGTSEMWTDPYISKQLLQLHIQPEHDVASRSSEKIEYLSNWILKQVKTPAMKILDLGCGPGLYAEYFAQKGHAVTGIDFSENSIRYAKNQACEKQLVIDYLHLNYLEMEFENQFDLVTMIYLDFCALLPHERDKIIKKIYHALKNGGAFIFDVVNEKNMEQKILSPKWEVCENGFWKASPYIVLSNGYHYKEARALANHHVVIGNDSLDSYIFWSLYYEKNDLVSLFKKTGFASIENHEKVLPESDDCWNGENITFYRVVK